MKDIYKMKLHENFAIDANNCVLRVPGGWVYNNACFVPHDNEFQTITVRARDVCEIPPPPSNSESLGDMF